MADLAAAQMWGVEGRPRRRVRLRSPSTEIESLYRQLAPQVLGYLYAHGAPDPEDVLGEVFYQVARDFEQFSGGRTDRRRWVFGVARNRLIDAVRRRSARPVIADAELPDLDATDPPEAWLDDELVAALAEVTDDQREVIVLRFVADLSIRDVAAVTQREVGAVKALQHRGLEALRRSLTARAEEPAGQ